MSNRSAGRLGRPILKKLLTAGLVLVLSVCVPGHAATADPRGAAGTRSAG